jgi:hypothetical protein
MPPVRAIFDAARHFGLTEDEICETADACLHDTGGEATVADYLDELTAALAARVLFKQRRSAAPSPRAADTSTAR